MTNDDDTKLEWIDDLTPPQPDDALLGRVVSRGRQRRLRRRTIFGAIAGSVAVVAIGSGVALAQHDDASPHVSIQAITPTTAAAATDPNPQAGDFSGMLTARATETTVGHDVFVSLDIRNISDHVLEGARGSLPNSVAIVCANDLSPDGHTSTPLRGEVNLFFVNAQPLAPGDTGDRTATFEPDVDDVGTVTCEGVIVTTSAQWQDGTVTSVARIRNIPPVSFTVNPAETRTTPPSGETSSTTSTTRPGP